MPKLRKFNAYRRLERPNTRISKYRAKSYVRARPASKVVRYDMGSPTQPFTHTVMLVAKDALQVRHNAMESARQSSNKLLEKSVGKNNFFMRIRIYPHHILRENPLASGAGADRMSTGMKMSFGKPIGIAAQIHRGQEVVELRINEPHLAVAKRAIHRFCFKFPGTYAIQVAKV